LSTNTSDATVIKAFAARYARNTISIAVSRRNQLLLHLNGQALTLEQDSDTATATSAVVTFQVDDLMITKNLTSNQITLSWPLGVSMEITPILVNIAGGSLVLSIAVAVSGTFHGYWTYGLIGSYDGNPANDLRSSNGSLVGTVDTLTAQQIHEV
jgi:hypothetical protein